MVNPYWLAAAVALERISTKLARSLRGALARRSNLDRSSARRPEIASLSLAMTIEVDGAP
jgi:hypothetical protein